VRIRTWFEVLALCAVLAGCGGGGGGGSSNNTQPPAGAPPARFTIGGQVSGLRGSGLVLQIGQGETLSVQAGGAFAFPTSLADGSGYEVRVIAQPTNLTQLCRVSNGIGTLAGANVSNVLVDCLTSTFRVGGALSGLRGSGLRLRLRPVAGQTQFLSPTAADGSYEFPTSLDDGTVYEITIDGQPVAPGQACSIVNSSGTVNGRNVDASITCTTPTFTVGGTVSGLNGQGLVLTNNGVDPLTISSNGPFTFPTRLSDFTPFNVQVATPPSNPKQLCAISNSAGLVTAGDFTFVTIQCTATQQLGSAGDDEALAAGVDGARNLYVAGRTTGSLDGSPNAGGWDGFLFKFDSGGEVRWKRQLRSSGNETIEALSVMATGETYVAGSTTGNLQGTNAGGDDAFVARYDRDGNVQWIRQLGTAAADIVHGIDFRADGSVFIVGETRGALGAAVAGESDLFVARFDVSGTLLWLRQLGSAAADVAFGVSVDATDSAHVAGSTAGNLDGVSNTSGGEVGFIVKYDAMGNRLVTQLVCQVGCLGNKPPSTRYQTRINGIATGVSGESYLAGWMRDDASGSLGLNGAWATRKEANGFESWLQVRSRPASVLENSDIVLGKGDGILYMIGNDPGVLPTAFVTSLIPLNQQQVFSTLIGGATPVEALAVTTDVLSNTYVVGKTSGSVDGNQHLGGTDIFLVRLNEAGQQQ
jgi:hypothetical protein